MIDARARVECKISPPKVATTRFELHQQLSKYKGPVEFSRDSVCRVRVELVAIFKKTGKVRVELVATSRRYRKGRAVGARVARKLWLVEHFETGPRSSRHLSFQTMVNVKRRSNK